MKALPPPSFTFGQLLSDPDAIGRISYLLSHPLIARINRGYKSWRAVRPMARAEKLRPENVWLAVKFQRSAARRPLPFARAEGGSFGFTENPVMLEQLHRIDQVLGGGGPAALNSPRGLIADPTTRARFAIQSMMEEAIESSRIEGAITTRSDALELLRSGRAPRTPHETMVVNNYAAMQEVKRWFDQELTISRLHALQRIVTRGTLEKSDQAGRFRESADHVRIVDERTGEVVFTPPPAEGLAARVQQICEFANHSHTGDDFIHPIVKACILHFMLGYEHPYCDGNGRTARAIFYWMALRSGYRVFEYMAISERIRKSWAKYATAYLNSELDDGDVTYFIFYKLRVISQSIDQLTHHLDAEETRIRRSLELIASAPGVNLRQRMLLDHALRHPKVVYTVKAHATSNQITPTTARTDLEGLVTRGYLKSFKAGRTVAYVLSPDAESQLDQGRQ